MDTKPHKKRIISLTVKVITTTQSLEALRADWNNLLANSGNNNLYLSWEWIHSWCSSMLSPTASPFIVTVRDHKNLIGVAPLVVVVQNNQDKVIQLLGQAYSYHLGFIALSGHEEETYNAIWNFLFDECNILFNRIEFIHFGKDTVFDSVLSNQAAKRNLNIEREIQNPCKVLALPDNYYNYQQYHIPSTNFKRNIIREFRILNQGYNVKYFFANKTNFMHYWTELLRLHREMMEYRNKGSALKLKSFSLHLQQVAQIFIEQDKLFLSVMEIDQIPAAIQLNIVHNKSYNALTMGVNYHLIQKIPNANLTFQSIAFNIKKAIETGCKIFDLGGGHHDYKYKFGGLDTGGVKLTIHAPPSSGIKQKKQYLITLLARKIVSYLCSPKYILKSIDTPIQLFKRKRYFYQNKK